jgi:branched-chain amino acid transport system ATP-binding protein
LYFEVKGLTVCFDTAMVLNAVSLQVEKGEFVSLVGPNGAGKSTLLRAIAGLVKWERDALKGTRSGRILVEGAIHFEGHEIFDWPAYQIARRGLILSPERGRPFREMTVRDNLMAAAYLCKDKGEIQENLERVYTLFPILQARQNQVSGTLSGGELTMLAISRSLMSKAKLMLVDEPSTGLAPKIKESLFARLREVHGLGITVLMAEQDVGYAFDLAGRNYVLSQGRIIAHGGAAELLEDELIRKTYLGL